MRIPHSNRKCAIIVVDVQPAFLNERNAYIVKNILELLNSSRYDLYIEATFHAEKGSLWEIQQDWICPEGEKTKTVPELAEKLSKLNAIKVHKETKSAFKGNVNLSVVLKEAGIREIHVVGVDTNDCVLATAYEAFDLGFITYVIEECCQSSSSEKLHEYAIELLRGQNMTNNSVNDVGRK